MRRQGSSVRKCVEEAVSGEWCIEAGGNGLKDSAD